MQTVGSVIQPMRGRSGSPDLAAVEARTSQRAIDDPACFGFSPIPRASSSAKARLRFGRGYNEKPLSRKFSPATLMTLPELPLDFDSSFWRLLKLVLDELA
jgi:hypothetical protein